MKLFCFAYAGGSAFFYYKWKRRFNISDNIEIIPLEYKGHGIRTEEGGYNNFKEMINDMLILLLNNLEENEPFMLFGHSMGAYVAFRVINILEKKGIYAKHIFLSGSLPPCFWTKREHRISFLTDDEFMNEIISYGGIENEIFDYPEIYNLIIKTLRNDFEIIEAINNDLLFLQIKSNISVLNGLNDKLVTQEKINIWKKYSSGKCTIKFYDGGHFYLNDHLREICDYILKISKS